MGKLFGAAILSLLAFTNAQSIDSMTCVAPTVDNNSPTYNYKQAVLDMDKFKIEVERRNLEIKNENPEAKILSFEQIKEMFGDKLIAKMAQLKKMKEGK